MTKTVQARFTNGVLTPLEPLDLPEGILVELNIQTLDDPGPDAAASAGGEEEDAGLLQAMLEVSIDDPNEFVSEAEVMATLLGEHRLGITQDGDTIILRRLLHRSEIYRNFP